MQCAHGVGLNATLVMCSLPCCAPCRYPGLLLACYYFALKWCAHEPVFQVKHGDAVRTAVLLPLHLRSILCYSSAANNQCLSPHVQPYYPDAAAALLEHLAPNSVRQPCLPGDAPLAASSIGQVQPLAAANGTSSQGTQAQLKAADSALLAAQQAAAAAAAAAAALVASQAGAAEQPLPAQQPTASPPPPRPAELQLARSPQGSLQVGGSEASMQQQAGTALLARPSSGARPVKSERPPPGLQYEPSLPDRDMPPGKLPACLLG